MPALSRRQFMSESALLAIAGATLAELQVQADEPKKESKPVKKAPASERLRVAIIGFNGQGTNHIKYFAGLPDADVAVVCDCDASLEKKGTRQAEAIQGTPARFEQDLRRVMEDKSVDAVSIATPNHWHSLAAIWAIEAGKDVYVEKPVSHNVFEGRQLVNAARKHQRIVQTGTQSRGNRGMREAIAFIHSGGIGSVKKAKGLCYKFRPTIGTADPRPAPKDVDFDLWCGPAPQNPIVRPRFHYDWHWFWAYGNGDLGNQGIHEMDKARWGLGVNVLCDTVCSFGGRWGYTDCGETANTQICRFDFGDKHILFEVRGLKTGDPFDKNFGKNFVGNIWYGSEGMVVSSSYDAAVALRPDGEVVQKFTGGGNHVANFVKAVKSRRREDLNAEVLEGHLSSALCHLANISYQLGTPHPLRDLERLYPEAAMQVEITRLRDHLGANGVSLGDDLRVRVGPTLKFDSQAERFDDAAANALLSREYRKGFEVRAVEA